MEDKCLKPLTLLERFGYKGDNFIKETVEANGKGTLFSAYRENIYELINNRNCRRNNIVINLAKGISKACDVNNIDPASFKMNCFEDIDDLYMHTYVINGGYNLAIIVLSDYLLDESIKKESKIYGYEGTDGLLFPFLFICTHAIELSMKTFIYAHGCDYDKDHNITDLLERCIAVAFNGDVKDVLSSYSCFIKELDDVVSNGFAMRYSFNKKRDNYLKFIYVIDVEVLRNIVFDFTNFMSRFAYGHCKYF